MDAMLAQMSLVYTATAIKTTTVMSTAANNKYLNSRGSRV